MIVQAGSVDVTTYFVLRTAADGTETTGVTITDIDLQFCRSGSLPSAKVDATALAAVDSAHADNKAIEVDATDQPGLLRVDWPDAAFASGVPEVILTVKLANSFTEHLRVELVDYDPHDSVRMGLTALPNAAADAAGGLVTGDGSVTFTAGIGNRPSVDATALGGTVQSATDLKDFADAGYDPATKKVQGVVLCDSLSAAGLDSIVVETGMNARQALSIISSGVAGVLAGAATTTITIAAAGVPATNRITATVDADGNRSAVSLSLPA